MSQQYCEDWSVHLLNIEKLCRTVKDASNAGDYIKALEAVVVLRVESQMLKNWCVNAVMSDD